MDRLEADTPEKVAYVSQTTLLTGSRSSSDFRRQLDLAHDRGAEADLVDNESQVLVRFFCNPGAEEVSELELMRENVRFMLPRTIRQALGAQAG